jgi:hypothetical protein
MSHPSSASTERPEQLGTTGSTTSTTSKAPEQVVPEQSFPGTTGATASTTREVLEQVAPEQSLPGTAGATASTTSEAPEQVAPEQSLPRTPVEKQVPKTNQSMSEQTMAPTWSTQGGLSNAAARGKSVATSSLARLRQERKQTSAEQAAESDDDVLEEI